MRQSSWLVALMIVLMAGITASAQAQNQGGPGGPPGARQGPGGRQGGPQNFDPARGRQMMMDRLREQLGSSDEEWKVLEPKIEAVMTAQRDARGGGMFMGPQRRGPEQQQNESAIQRASRDLRQALESQDTPAAQIEQKLTAYREARAAAQKQFVDAQKALQELLTPRQEAILVSNGMLD